jgi:hypothetical protein
MEGQGDFHQGLCSGFLDRSSKAQACPEISGSPFVLGIEGYFSFAGPEPGGVLPFLRYFHISRNWGLSAWPINQALISIFYT